jgi:hypothetical protein
MRSADGPASEMRSAEAAHSADMTTAAESAAAASISGARCSKSERDDRRCCSENLRHDEISFDQMSCLVSRI